MKNLSRHCGTIENLTRLPSSRNGNPRYSAYCGGVHFVTAVDSMYGYSLPNYVGKQVEILVGSHYGKTTLSRIA